MRRLRTIKSRLKFIQWLFIVNIIIVFTICIIRNNNMMDKIVDDPYYPYQWALNNDGNCKKIKVNKQLCSISEFKSGIDLNMNDAWDIFEQKDANRKNVVIAIIDTGVDYQHEDLKNMMWINSGEVANDNIDNDNNGFIDDIYGWNFCENSGELLTGEDVYENDHGTYCAGIIAAEHNNIGITGIAGFSNVKIMSIKVLEGLNHEGKIENLIKGIKYADAMGANICNLSLGVGVNDENLRKIIYNSKMLFVVSAGNGGINLDEKPIYPASFKLDNVITVCNIGFNGELYADSNYGKDTVDIAAPGTYIYSTCVGGYDYDTGSSMAAPMVTAAAALVYSYNDNNLTASKIKKIMRISVSKIKNLQDKVKSGGMLNIDNVMKIIIN